MTKKDLLSEAAQRLIDEHRMEKELQMLSQSEVPTGFESKADAKAKASAVRRPVYTADAMVDLMIQHPEYTHAEFADHFGYRASWFAGVLVSNNFQLALDKRRTEVNNPMLTGTMQDLFRSMTVQALTVLQSRLDDPKASEDLIIKAITAGTKALGMGMPGQVPADVPKPPTLDALAARLSTPKLIVPTEPARDYTIEAALNEIPR